MEIPTNDNEIFCIRKCSKENENEAILIVIKRYLMF